LVRIRDFNKLIQLFVAIYEALNKYSQKKLYELKIVGKVDYLHVFRLILRLRQCCDHPLLVKTVSSGETDENSAPSFIELDDLLGKYCDGNEDRGGGYAKQLVSQLEEMESSECPVPFPTFCIIHLLIMFWNGIGLSG
jgi:DNA repair protein RAD5